MTETLTLSDNLKDMLWRGPILATTGCHLCKHGTKYPFMDMISCSKKDAWVNSKQDLECFDTDPSKSNVKGVLVTPMA